MLKVASDPSDKRYRNNATLFMENLRTCKWTSTCKDLQKMTNKGC